MCNEKKTQNLNYLTRQNLSLSLFFITGSSCILIRGVTSPYKRCSQRFVSVGNNSWDLFSQHDQLRDAEA